MDEAFEDSWNNLMIDVELDSTRGPIMMVRSILITIQLSNGTHLSQSFLCKYFGLTKAFGPEVLVLFEDLVLLKLVENLQSLKKRAKTP